MNLLVTDRHLEELPLFPLPGTVFFPSTLLPLHVFEPRYRAMTRYCIRHSWPMAVVLIEPGHESAQTGDPPVAPMASIGHLVMREELEDGRFNIVLQGMARIRILEEQPRQDRPYRTARAQLVSDYVLPDRNIIQRKAHAVRVALTSLMIRDRRVRDLVSGPLMETRSPAVLADALSALIFTDPARRQDQLACTRVHERLDRVLDRLAELLAVSGATPTATN
jgi:Lon protease-like protein